MINKRFTKKVLFLLAASLLTAAVPSTTQAGWIKDSLLGTTMIASAGLLALVGCMFLERVIQPGSNVWERNSKIEKTFDAVGASSAFAMSIIPTCFSYCFFKQAYEEFNAVHLAPENRRMAN